MSINKIKHTIAIAAVSVLIAAVAAGCSQVKEPTVSVTTSTSESISESASKETNSTAVSSSTTESAVASQTTETPSDDSQPNPAFAEILGGIIGSRDSSGIVYNLEKTYFKNAEIFEKAGHDIYSDAKFPQIKAQTETAKLFNSHIRETALRESENMYRDIAQAIENNLYDADTGWVYYDYGVIESDKYLSIIMARSDSFYKLQPFISIETYIFDKQTEEFVPFDQVVSDFGIDIGDFLSKLENLFAENNIDLKIYENYFYREKYKDYLFRLWNTMLTVRDMRDPSERFLILENFSNDANAGIYVDESNRLHVVTPSHMLDGVNEDTGNFSFKMTFQDAMYNDIPATERKVNPVFEYYSSKIGGVGENINAMVVKLPDVESDDFAAIMGGLLSENNSADLIPVNTHHSENHDFFVLILRYSASVTRVIHPEPMAIEYKMGATHSVGDMQIISLDISADSTVLVESRDEWFAVESNSDTIIDITEHIASNKNGISEEILNNLIRIFK